MNAIFSMPNTSQGVFAINTPTIHVSVQLHPFHEVEIKQHRVIMTEYVFHTLEANLQHQYSFKEFRRKHELTKLLGLRMDATNKIYLWKQRD